jgi:MftR C-terminal domain
VHRTDGALTRLGQDTDALAPRVLAGACIETISIVFETWMATGHKLTEIPSMLDQALQTLSTLG